jgi:phage tail-like protein
MTHGKASAGSTRTEDTMPEFSVNPSRLDPYKNFKFRILWDQRHVAGISRMSGLRRITEVVEHREGGDTSTSHKSPGRTQYEAITLERGVTHDEEFERWANSVWRYGFGGNEVALSDFRKEVVIQLFNEAGQLVKAYNIHRCWPSEYQALPDLESNSSAVAIEMLKLEHEGWERDEAVVEPKEP